MAQPEDPDFSDPRLQDAAGLLKGMPQESPGPSLAEQVVAQVKPVAVRRERLYRGIFAAALLSALVFAVVFFNLLHAEGP